MRRYAAKRDTSEPDIIAALEQVGAQVWPLDYPVDLLVRFREVWHLLECKTGRGKKLVVAKDKRQLAQHHFLAITNCPIVCTPLQALRAIGAV